MIILLLPLKFYRFGDHIFADFVVDVGFVGLAELVAAGNAVGFAVFDKIRTSLMKPKRYATLHALLPNVQNPIVVAGTSTYARFAACGYLFDLRVEVRCKVDVGKHWTYDDAFVLDGQF